MIQTKRLTLRPLHASDAERIAVLGGDWDVASMTGRIPYPYSAEAAQHWLEGVAAGEVVFAIDYQGALIGICGYTPVADGSAEMGYWLGKPYWRQGLATEAARALMNYGFTRGGIKRFTCSHFTENPQSARVVAKLGFRAIGLRNGWCEARQQDLPAKTYTRRRPWTSALRALAS
jgi:[ribosomal protein S5]-alanine N-acetyltransferase